ncbi:hypothetical protein PL11201_530015 [Planktothrix sp. PCC 11201]|uniref:hypothetical protein n=1 Tax=Planktothrix sp. PCC 11201 TaxID=1729650 RepID=UPI000922E1AF|nr:hypothetical protein [Planktothrix sp. PCC 11201]SKB13685.1 hypothetical protein PL11201_530015 [Planktothrix sp. PCC 11201]
MTLINYIQTAKDFADSYGVDRLDRLMTLAQASENSLITQPSGMNGNRGDILQEVEAVGFQLNAWLKNLILSTPIEVVRNAMAVVEENERWRIVKNREGLLVEAIRNQWKPNISA